VAENARKAPSNVRKQPHNALHSLNNASQRTDNTRSHAKDALHVTNIGLPRLIEALLVRSGALRHQMSVKSTVISAVAKASPAVSSTSI
jgi:hypothetical protein